VGNHSINDGLPLRSELCEIFVADPTDLRLKYVNYGKIKGVEGIGLGLSRGA
jgi:hypothetical protein